MDKVSDVSEANGSRRLGWHDPQRHEDVDGNKEKFTWHLSDQADRCVTEKPSE